MSQKNADLISIAAENSNHELVSLTQQATKVSRTGGSQPVPTEHLSLQTVQGREGSFHINTSLPSGLFPSAFASEGALALLAPPPPISSIRILSQ
jgi:hypothetical protein